MVVILTEGEDLAIQFEIQNQIQIQRQVAHVAVCSHSATPWAWFYILRSRLTSMGNSIVERSSYLHNGISHTGETTSEGKARLTTYSYLGGGHRQDMVPPYSHGQYWTVDVHPPELSIWHRSVRTTQLSIRRVSVWQQHAVWNGYYVFCTHQGQATDLYIGSICHHPFR